MRRLICPLLLVAALPAHARFCDPLPQDPITGGGQECTQTRVAHYDPSIQGVAADYSEVALSGTPTPLEFALDLAALQPRFEGKVTLLEFGIARGAVTVESPPSPGGRLALEAEVGEGASQNRQLYLRWVWIEGSPTNSVMTPADQGQRESLQEVVPPMPVEAELSVTVGPDADWCHLLVSASDGVTDKYGTYQVAPGSACTTAVLRSGVMGPNLTDGMTTLFDYHSQWLFNR